MSKTASNNSILACPQKNVSPKMLPEDAQTKVCYDRRLAERFGINEAILLGRMIWSIEGHRDTENPEFFHDGQYWMYDTIPALMKYSQLGRKQILNALANLSKEKIIEKGQFDRKFAQRRNWYSVDIDAIYMATQMSCPFTPKEPKGNSVSSRKGTVGGAERGLRMVPKGDNTSLYTKNPSERLSNTHTNSPPTPQGEKSESDLLNNNLNSFEEGESKIHGSEMKPSQNGKKIPPIHLKERTIETHPHLAPLGRFALSDFEECSPGNCKCGSGGYCMIPF